MNWFQRTFHSKKQETRNKKQEGAVTSCLLPLASKRFRLFTPVLLALFTGFLMIHTAAVVSSPTTATQGDWSGGADTVNTTTTFTGWTKYYSKGTDGSNGQGIVADAVNIQLKSNSYTATDDGTLTTTGTPAATGGTFAAGTSTSTSTAVSGAGALAKVALSSATVIDGGTGADGSIDLLLTNTDGTGNGGCRYTASDASGGAGQLRSGVTWDNTSKTCTINTTTHTTPWNFKTVNIPSTYILTTSGTTNPLTIKASGNVTVAGSINLVGKGLGGGAGGTSLGACQGSTGTGAVANAGGGGATTCGPNYGGGGGGGASHMAAGGNGASGAWGYTPGQGATVIYDVAASPSMFGSGGGGGAWGYGTSIGAAGGAGGGAIKILTSGTVTVSGTIDASGAVGGAYGGACDTTGEGGGGGGGSGGSIWIQTGTLAGNGTIFAKGGQGSIGCYATTVKYGGGGGSGGGGGIALAYVTDSSTITKSASGGVASGGYVSGNAGGTVSVVQTVIPYFPSGTFESATIDVGGTAGVSNYALDTISWNATVPSQANGAGMEIPATTTGLVGLWHMENNWNDTTGGDNLTADNGTRFGTGTTFSTSAKIGSYAGQFNGTDDYVDTTFSGGALNFGTGSFTIEFWMKTTDTSGMIYDMRPLGTISQVQTVTSPNYLGFRTGNNWLYLGQNVLDGQWHHITVVRNSTNRLIYSDGVLRNSDALVSDNLTGYTNLYLGVEGGTGTFLNGSIDEVAVYNRALLDNEIKTHYYGSFRLQIAASGCSTGEDVALNPSCNGTHASNGWNGVGDTGYVGYDGTANTFFTQPVGLWHLNEASGNASDSSGSGYTLTNTGVTYNSTTAKLLGANGASFTADTNALSSSALSAMSQFTMEGWVKFATASQSTGEGYIFAIPTKDPAVVRSNTGNKILVYADNVLKITSTTAISDNTVWHHIALMADGTNLKLYIDGSLDATGSAAWTGSSTAAGLYLGDDGTATVDYFTGYLDEFALYNRALTQAEVTARYNANAGREGAVWDITGDITGTSALNNLDNKQYLRYKAYFGTADTAYTPQLDDITLGYSGFPSSASLTSSKFDAGNSGNILTKLIWDETNTANGPVTVSLSSAASSGGLTGTFSDFTYGATPTTGCARATNTVTCTFQPGSAFLDANDDQWFQYKVTPGSATGSSTPTVDNVNVVYDTASFALTGSTSATAGAAHAITVTAKDSSGLTLNTTNGYTNYGTLSTPYLSITASAGPAATKGTPVISKDNSCATPADDFSFSGGSASDVNGFNGFTLGAQTVYGCFYDAGDSFTLTASETNGISATTTPLGPVTVTDNAPPTAVTVTYNGGASSSQASTNISVALSATDAASAVNSSDYDLEYQEAALSNNSPGAFGSWTDVGTNNGDSSPVTFTGSSGKAYQFRVSAVDTYANRSGYTTGTNWVGVDTAAPTGTAVDPFSSAYSNTPSGFTVSWAGAVDTGGSGLAAANTYKVKYKVNAGGTWTDWTTTASASAVFGGGGSPITLTSGNTYFFEAGASDNAGNWEVFSGGSGEASIIYDAAAPTVSGFILKGNVSGSTDYVNLSVDNQVAKATGVFNDTGGSGTTLLVQFSETGAAASWGAYPGSGTTNTVDTGDVWAANTYKTITASSTSQDITNAWRFATPDGSKTLGVRVKDGAGNVTRAGISSLSNAGGGSWGYHKPVVITGSTAGAQTDYQVLVTVDTAALISAGKMQPTGADIRFANTTGTELPYWIESGINTASTKIWVKVDSIPASPSTATIYMYYGNSSATSSSNGDNTFIFFDDFEDGIVDTSKWAITSTVSESGGIISIGDAVNDYDQLLSIPTFTRPVILEMAGKLENGSGGYNDYGFGSGSSGGPQFKVHWETDPAIEAKMGESEAADSPDVGFNAPYTASWKIIWKSDGSADFYVNDVLKVNRTTNLVTIAMPLSFRTYNIGPSNISILKIRKYVSPEPSVGTPGSEGVAGGDTITLDTTAPTNPSGLSTTPATSSTSYSDNTTPTLTWTTDGTDATSGVQKYQVRINGGSWSDFTKGSAVPAGISSQAAAHTIEARAVDNAGNASSGASLAYYCDTSAPGAFTNTLAEGTNPAYQYISGTTLYYNSGFTGDFTVTAPVSDTESGIQKVNFPVLGAGFTGDGDDTSSPYSAAYSWTTSATTSPGAKNTTAYNYAGLTTTSGFTVTNDAAAPAGGSLTYTDGNYAAASVSMTLADGTDGGSGIATKVLQRQEASFTDNTVGTFGSFADLAANPVSPYTDTTAALGKAYKYQYVVTDNVGNAATYCTPDCNSPNVARVIGAATQLVFNAATGPFTVAAGTEAGAVKVEAKDQFDNIASNMDNQVDAITLSSTSGTMKFYKTQADAQGDINSITKLTLAANPDPSGTAIFWFRDTTASVTPTNLTGTHTITASLGQTPILQTSDTGSGDTPNAGGFDAGTKTSTVVSNNSVALGVTLDIGTGADGSIDLSKEILSGSAKYGGCTLDDSGVTRSGTSWAGSTCTINTTTNPTWNFTTVDIPSTYILTTSGTTNGLTIKATGNVTIDGSINLDGKGCGGGGGGAVRTTGTAGSGGSPCATGGTGAGLGGTGASTGNGAGGSGGAYGGNSGAGGIGYYTSTTAGGASVAAHGSSAQPIALGAGGAGGGGGWNIYTGGAGGAGGGAIKIIASDTITINGLITANGSIGTAGSSANCPNNSTHCSGGGGGGSGGSIWIQANAITGNATTTANGGQGGAGAYNTSAARYGGAGGGGGGGRIAIYYITNNYIGSPTATGGANNHSGNASYGVSSAGVTPVPESYTEVIPYSSTGTFESGTIDFGGAQDLGAISWTATVPAQTGADAFRLQLAASDCANGVDKTQDADCTAGHATAGWGDADTIYVGPGGTSATYFTTSGTATPASLDNKRYIRYKLSLATVDTAYTPQLDDITITYGSSDNQNETVTPAALANGSFTLNNVAAIVANADGSSKAVYTVTRKDEFGNDYVSGDTIVYLYTDSAPGDYKFFDKDGNEILSNPPSVTISGASATPSSVQFQYIDKRTNATGWTIKVSDATPADDTTNINDAQDLLPVTPDVATYVFSSVLTTNASDETAGTAFEITLTAKDQYGNAATTYTGAKTINLTYSGGPSNAPDATVPTKPASASVTFNASGIGSTTGGTFNFVYSSSNPAAETPVITAADSGTSSITGATPAITVKPDAASYVYSSVVTTNSQTEMAGTTFDITLTTKDQFGNAATTYTGAKTVNLTYSGGPTNSPNATPFVAPASAAVTFNASGVGSTTGGGFKFVNISETPTITAKDSVTVSITGNTGAVTVRPNIPTNYAVLGNGASSVTQTAGGTPVVMKIIAKDQYGNTANAGPNDYSDTITLTFTGATASPTGDNVSRQPTLTNNVEGVRTIDTQTAALVFTNGVFDGATAGGGDLVLYHTSDTSISVTGAAVGGEPAIGTTSSPLGVTVNPAALGSFQFTTFTVPNPVTAAVSFGTGSDGMVQVAAYDTYNNIKTDYTGGGLVFSSDDPGSETLPGGPYTFPAGVSTFNGAAFTLVSAGARAITVADGAVSETSSNINVKANFSSVATPAQVTYYDTNGAAADNASELIVGTMPANAIAWTLAGNSGAVSDVKLEYSTNGFANESQTTVIANSTPNAGSYSSWTIPNAVGDTVKVRVSDATAGNPASSLVSSALSIVPTVVNVTGPTSASSWAINDTRDVTWTVAGGVGTPATRNFTIEYYDGPTKHVATSNAIGTITRTATSGDGTAALPYTYTYSWTIPTSAPVTSGANLKITESASPNGYRFSDNFTMNGSIKLAKHLSFNQVPNAFTATGSAINNALLYGFALNNPLGTINITQFQFTMPTYTNGTLDYGTHWANLQLYKDVSPLGTLGVEDTEVCTTANFTVNEAGGTITCTPAPFSPAGSYLLIADLNNLSGGEAMSIDLDTTGVSATQVTVSEPTVVAPSVHERPLITVNPPAPGATWNIGDTKDIKWSFTGTLSTNVKIEYYNGSAYSVVENPATITGAGSVPDPYVKSWANIANTGFMPSNAARIRVTDNVYPYGQNESAVFNFKGTAAFADYAAGAQPEALTATPSVTNAELIGFKLNPQGENLSVSGLVVDISSVTGLVGDNFTNVKLMVDTNADGNISGGETTVAATGVPDTTTTAPAALTFGAFTVSKNTDTNYIVVANIGNIDGGDTFALSLDPANITATGADSTLSIAVSGSALTKTHLRPKMTVLTPASPNGTTTAQVGTLKALQWKTDAGVVTGPFEIKYFDGSVESTIIASGVVGTDITGDGSAGTPYTFNWTPEATGRNVSATGTIRVRDLTFPTGSQESAQFTLKGNLTVKDHAVGQVTNKFDAATLNDARIFRFGIGLNGAGTYAVNYVELDATPANLTYGTDWTDVRIYRDLNNDGNTDETALASVTPSFASNKLRLTFSPALSLTGNTTSDFIVTSDFANLTGGEQLAADLAAAGVDAPLAVNALGTMTPVTHLRPTVTVTGPTSASTWKVGETNKAIGWTTAGTVSNAVTIDLEYLDKNNVTQTLNLTTNAASASSYTYAGPVPPQVVTTTARLKLTDNTYPYGTVYSQDFKIEAVIAVTTPDGTKRWAAGYAHPIQGTVQGTIDSVLLTYPDTTTEVAPVTAGAFTGTWTPALGYAGVTISARDNTTNHPAATVNSVSFAVSKINADAFVAANSNRLTGAAAFTVAGTTAGVGTVDIQYYNGSTYVTADADSSGISVAGGSYSNLWNIPLAARTTKLGKIRIISTDANLEPSVGAAYAESPVFTVYGTLDLINPGETALESYVGGNPINIQWAATKGTIPSVKIYYYRASDGPSNATLITTYNTDTTASTQSFPWTPTITDPNVRIRVEDVDHVYVSGAAAPAEVTVTSANSFSVTGITANAPTGASTWYVGGNGTISWTSQGVDNITLRYSPNGGTTYCDIPGAGGLVSAEGVTNDWAWNNIPETLSCDGAQTLSTLSYQGRIKVQDFVDGSPYAETELFVVSSTGLAMVAPTTAGGPYNYDSPLNIQWRVTDLTGDIDKVDLFYATVASPSADETDWTAIPGAVNVTTATNGATNTFNAWTPNISSPNLTIRARFGTQEPYVRATSETFKLKGQLTLANHTSAQVSNGFISSGLVKDMSRFKLTPAAETVRVDSLAFSLSGINGLANGNLTSVQLLENGTTPVGGTPAVTIGTTDKITFTTPFNAAAATDYVLRVTFDSLDTLDAMTVDLTTSGLTAAGLTSGAAVTKAGSVSAPIHVAPKLVITGSATMNAGATNNLTISAKNVSNSIVSSYTGSKSITFALPAGSHQAPDGTSPSAAGSSFAAGNTVTATVIFDANGEAIVPLVLYKVEGVTINATDANAARVTSLAGLDVTVGPAIASASTSTITAATPVIAGGAGSAISVRLKDAYGSDIPGKPVTLASSRGGTDTITTSPATTNGSGIATFTLTTNTRTTATPITVTAVGDGLTQTAPVTVNPASASASTSTILPSPSSIAAGGAGGTIAVMLKDQYNNFVLDGTTVTFTAKRAGATDAADTITASATTTDGLATAALTSTKSTATGTPITVEATGDGLTQTTTVAVTSGGADHVKAAAVDGSMTADETEVVTITILDSNNNVITSGVPSSATVTVTVNAAVNGAATKITATTLGSPSGLNTNSVTGTLSSGTAAVTISDTTPQALTVSPSSTGLAGTAVDANIIVYPGVPTTFTVATQNSGIENVDTAFTLTLTAKDAFGNTVLSGPNNYTGAKTVSFTSNATQAPDGLTNPTIPVPSLSVTFTNGVGTTAAGSFRLVNISETPTITATQGLVSGTTAAVTVRPGAINNYALTNTTPQVATVGWSEAVTSKDQFGNTVTTNNSTVVTMTSNNGNAVFYTNGAYAATTTTYTLSGGVTAIYVKDSVPENLTLTATDSNSKTGTSGSIAVQADFAFTKPTVADSGADAYIVHKAVANNIAWTTSGTVANVKIEYRKAADPDVDGSYNPITESEGTANDGIVPNTGSYTWIVDDAVLAALDHASEATSKKSVVLRVSDASGAPTKKAKTASFEARYYKIQWNVKDANGAYVLGINAAEALTTIPDKPTWTVADNSLNPVGAPVVRYYPYNGDTVNDATYTTAFSRIETGTNYSVSADNWRATQDETKLLIMDTAATASISYEAKINAVYNAENDSINVSSWLTKKGVLADYTDQASTPEYIKVIVYDSAGNPLTPITGSGILGTSVTPNSQGIFTGIEYDPALGINQGSTYMIEATITYNNKDYTGVTGFVSPSVYSYETKINAIYNSTNDSIDVSSWLTKNGVLGSDITADPNAAISVNVYDAAGTQLNSSDLGTGKTPNSQGIFGGISFDPAGGLDPSIAYTLKVTITYNNKQYTGVSGFVSPSVYTFEAKIGAIYNSTNDSIVANIWLERSGTTVTDPGDMTFKVSNSAGTELSNQPFDGYDSTSDTIKDAKLISGVYTNIEYDPAGGLSSTQIYTVKADIVYRGRTYNAVASFAKGELGTISSDIAGIQASQAALPGTVSTAVSTAVSSDMTTQLGSQTTTLQGSMTTQTATLQGAITGQTTTLSGQIGSVGANVTALPTTVSTAVSTAVSSDMATQMAKGVQAELLTRPADVASGATIPIRFRTASGLSPKITVYDPNGTARVSAAAMKEISTTGIYEYKLTLDTAWGLGDFTVLVNESTRGSTDSLILHVGLGGMDEIYSKLTSASTTTSSSAGVSLDTIYAGVTTIQNNTIGLNTDITALLTRLGKSTDAASASTLFGKIAAIDTSAGNEEAILAGVDDIKNYVDTLEGSLGSSADAMSAETIFGRLAQMEDLMKDLGAGSKEIEDAKTKAKNLAKLMEAIRADLARGNMAEASAKLAALGQGLTDLNNDLSGLPAAAGEASVGSAFEDLKEMAAGGGLEGLVPLLEEIKASREAFNPENMTVMRNTVEELKSLMTEVRSLLDQEVNKPVVHGWLEEETE